ncbi:hypothetical protein [Melissococcus plutonius]|uniref:hypothetical protein n=1 Tax=Melissococcus plutonius TaxID=33970 RepID=UPI003C2D5E7C
MRYEKSHYQIRYQTKKDTIQKLESVLNISMEWYSISLKISVPSCIRKRINS